MLTIRKEQMEVLGAHMMKRFEDRVIRKIRKTSPARFEQDGEEKIRIFVQAAIRKGEQHGITEDDDSERFILIVLEHGLDFEKAMSKAEHERILENKKLPGDAKVALLARKFPTNTEKKKP